MPYNSQITRSDASALIPEDAAKQIVQGAIAQSAALSMFRKLPNMSRAQQRIPVLSALPLAYFVDGDTGLKQTAETAWGNKYLNAEEIACIVPIPQSVLDDSDYDIWGETMPRIEEAFGKVIDGAVFFGTNAPAAWPDDILTAATAAANVVTLGTGVDIYDDIMGESGVLAKVEADGFMVTGHAAAMTMKSRLRGLRDANGQPIFVRTMGEKTGYELDGETIQFPRNGVFTGVGAYMFSGDFSQAVYSVRQDMTYKLLTEAVIQDGAGDIIYNLAQQDMVALRCVMRVAWQVPNPINALQAVEASRYPFGALIPV